MLYSLLQVQSHIYSHNQLSNFVVIYASIRGRNIYKTCYCLKLKVRMKYVHDPVQKLGRGIYGTAYAIKASLLHITLGYVLEDTFFSSSHYSVL